MKTLKELFDEINDSDELKNALAESVRDEKLEEFLKAHGCDAGKDDVQNYIRETILAARDLNAEELKNVSGGADHPPVMKQSFVMPWSCHPSYSSLLDSETGDLQIPMGCK